MGIYTQFAFTAPKLIDFFRELGITVSSKDGVFTEASVFTLPSGASACILDEDAWDSALYSSEDMGLNRVLSGTDSSRSLAVWLAKHLSADDMCDEDEADDDFGAAFCLEVKNIFAEKYPDNDIWDKIAELDDLIESAEFLYFSYWGGYDFDCEYIEVKNSEMLRKAGTGDDDTCDGWAWHDLDGFIALAKTHFPAVKYERKSGKWIK